MRLRALAADHYHDRDTYLSVSVVPPCTMRLPALTAVFTQER